VKIVQSGLNSLLRFGTETAPQFSPADLSSAVQAAARAGLKTMVHANGRLPVEQAIEAGCHSVEHGFFMGRENLERLARRPVTWVPTACTMEAYAASLAPGSVPADIARKNLDHQLEQISFARQSGVTLATGTDSGSLGVHHGEALRQEIRLFMLAGHSLEAALACATGNGARLLGLDHELGTLCPGMPATFLAVCAHPRDLPAGLNRIQGIYLRGEEIQA
jgi:imidazolonepropionase-like amidohydrolase